LSISEDEAEKAYPTEYWNDGSGCKKVFAANTDDLQEAYIRGREAPPSDVEVEAVARKLMWWDRKPAWEGDVPSEDFFWNHSEPEMRANYLKDARDLLEVARKAVTE
jgi:hypothetical protein